MSIYSHINSQIHLFHRHSVKKSNYKIVASKADRIRQHLGMVFFFLILLFFWDRRVCGMSLFQVTQKQSI